METADWRPPSPLMTRQGWYVHELLHHGGGAGERGLDIMELLRIGEVWIDVITTRQYFLNLRTGQYEKFESECVEETSVQPVAPIEITKEN